MSTFLYAYTPDPELTEPPPDPLPEPNHAPQENSSYVGELSDGDYVQLLPNEDVEARLIGRWLNDGTLEVMDETAFAELRPLGNLAGTATDALDLVHYQGHKQRQRQIDPVEDSLAEYPADEQPFTLQAVRTLTTDDAWSHIPWGWTVAVFSQDPERDINARAIGVYSSNYVPNPDDPDDFDDPNDWDYLYTTGAFVLMDFEEGVNEEGIPIIVQRYGTICPIGQRLAAAEPVYFKLLLGAAPEGAYVLEDLHEGAQVTRLFWEHDQPASGDEE